MKRFPAIIAAFAISGVLAFFMFTIGASALSNQNTVPTLNQPANSTTSSSNSAQDPTQAQIQQYQNLISQYQAREKQYQDQLNNAVQQINQDNEQLQQYQQLLIALQQRGVIMITQDGRILIPGR